MNKFTSYFITSSKIFVLINYNISDGKNKKEDCPNYSPGIIGDCTSAAEGYGCSCS